jgi:hypothetical protein
MERKGSEEKKMRCGEETWKHEVLVRAVARQGMTMVLMIVNEMVSTT